MKVNDPPVIVALLRMLLAELDICSLETLISNDEVAELKDPDAATAWTDFKVSVSTDELHDTGIAPSCNALDIIRRS